MQKSAEIKRDWHLIDVQDQVLGRVATQIATLLIGKHKPTFTPHIDGGDYVVVINSAKIAVTGGKEDKKVYYHHSNFPGGMKEMTFGEMMEKFPTRAIEKAVYNMLPKNKLRSDRMTRLKIYADDQHKHESQITK